MLEITFHGEIKVLNTGGYLGCLYTLCGNCMNEVQEYLNPESGVTSVQLFGSWDSPTHGESSPQLTKGHWGLLPGSYEVCLLRASQEPASEESVATEHRG